MLRNQTSQYFFCLLILAYIKASNASEVDNQCLVPGECIFSQSIGIIPSNDKIQCLELCQNHFNCNWFTFYPDTDLCQLFVSCGSINDKQCPLCVAGHKDCPIPKIECWIKGLCLGNVTHTQDKIRYSCQVST